MVTVLSIHFLFLNDSGYLWMDIVASSIFSASFFNIFLGSLLESALNYKPARSFRKACRVPLVM